MPALTFARLVSVLKRIRQNPAFLQDIFLYFKNDLLAILGKRSYDYRILFIAGLPKSGTTWVRAQLARVPGYNIRPVDDPERVTERHDICESVFTSLPKCGYSIVKLHTRYTPENFAIIKKHVPKFIVMIRDLRDMCVSRYFHIKHEKAHRHFDLYNRESEEEGLAHCIEVIEDEYIAWVRDWVQAYKHHPETILLITYEELNQSPFSTFKKICDFYRLPVSNDFIREMAESKLRRAQNLGEQLQKSVGLRTTSTARKGVVGDWQNHFSDQHKQKFKAIAGDLLIELGYVKDFNW